MKDWLTFRLFLRCKKRRTTNKLLSGTELMRNSRDHVHARNIWIMKVAYALKKFKNSQLFENLNDSYIISMPTSANCKVKTERIILFMWNRESAFVFRRRVAKFFENFSRRNQKLSATPMIITSMPMAYYLAILRLHLMYITNSHFLSCCKFNQIITVNSSTNAPITENNSCTLCVPMFLLR